jgi:hypothetical protein
MIQARLHGYRPIQPDAPCDRFSTPEHIGLPSCFRNGSVAGTGEASAELIPVRLVNRANTFLTPGRVTGTHYPSLPFVG